MMVHLALSLNICIDLVKWIVGNKRRDYSKYVQKRSVDIFKYFVNKNKDGEREWGKDAFRWNFTVSNIVFLIINIAIPICKLLFIEYPFILIQKCISYVPFAREHLIPSD